MEYLCAEVTVQISANNVVLHFTDPFDCEEGPEKRSHPHDCRKYIVCSGQSKRMFVVECWEGLAFDPYTSKCVFDYIVEDKCLYGIFQSTYSTEAPWTTLEDTTTVTSESTTESVTSEKDNFGEVSTGPVQTTDQDTSPSPSVTDTPSTEAEMTSDNPSTTVQTTTSIISTETTSQTSTDQTELTTPMGNSVDKLKANYKHRFSYTENRHSIFYKLVSMHQ